MHRTTPFNPSFRAYTSGGARSVVTASMICKFMQEMAGNFMKNETRTAIELPQNYGFTSVVMDAIKSELGNIVGSAETFIAFMGGNRSFPVAGNMDDRRHRLMDLLKGELAMFGTQGMKQQLHMSADGMFGTRAAGQDHADGAARRGQREGHDQPIVPAAGERSRDGCRDAYRPSLAALTHSERFSRRASPTSSTSRPLTPRGGVRRRRQRGLARRSSDGMKMGQKSLKDKNKKAKSFFDVTKDKTRAAGKSCSSSLVQAAAAAAAADDASGGSEFELGNGSGAGSLRQQILLRRRSVKRQVRALRHPEGADQECHGKDRLNRCRSRIRSPTSASSRISSSRNTRSPSIGSCWTTARSTTAKRWRPRSSSRSAPMRSLTSTSRCPIRIRPIAKAGGAISRPTSIWNAWPIGSKLWLLRRSAIESVASRQGATVQRVLDYISQCIQPFVTLVSCHGFRHRRRASTSSASTR